MNQVQVLFIEKTIADKWCSQIEKNSTFIRHIDGNTLNNDVSNLSYVKFNEINTHWDDWKFDWSCELSKKEIEYVRNNKLFRVNFFNNIQGLLFQVLVNRYLQTGKIKKCF